MGGEGACRPSANPPLPQRSPAAQAHACASGARLDARTAFGRRCLALASGSALLAPTCLQWLKGFGLPVIDAYGSTECGTIAVNGAASAGVRWRLEPHLDIEAPGGEVCVATTSMFLGYHGEGEAVCTANLTEDGLYRTGDVGEIAPDGSLVLRGRVSVVGKLSTGRSVCVPAAPKAGHAIRGSSALLPLQTPQTRNTSVHIARVTVSVVPLHI